MPASVVGITERINTATTSFVGDTPAGVVAGDLLIAWVASESSTAQTPPAGWTQIQQGLANLSDHRHGAYYRIADGSEGATYTWTIGGAASGIVTIARITGQAATSPINVSAKVAPGTNTTVAAPSITTTVDGCLLLCSYVAETASSGSSYTLPAALTPEFAETHSNGTVLAGGSEVLGAAGATGTRTATLSTSDNNTAISIAVAPGAGTALGQASESDVALPITSRKAAAVGQASETDTAQPVVPLKRASVGQASSTEAALPITARKIVAVNIATETDTALGIPTAGAGTPVGQASETDTALPVVPQKRAAVGQAESTETALPITARKVIAVGIATETDTALGITGAPHIIVLGIATETDTAPRISRLFAGAPVGGGSGEGTERPGDPGVFRIQLTSLHKPDNIVDDIPGQVASSLAVFDQFTDAEVDIPANDARTARVTISMHDPGYALVEEYETLIHVLYVTPNTAWPVFWGVITQVTDNSEAETVTLSCVDRSLGLQRAQIRYGDQILNESYDPDLPNQHGKGYVSLDSYGLLLLRDCGINTVEQTERGVPDLGIINGTDDTTQLPFLTLDKIEVKRGQEVWQTMLDVVAHRITPDFELNPVDTLIGAYAEINFYARQGNPDPDHLVLRDGWADGNCRINRTGGGRLTTHQHVLSTGDEKRVTVADADASARVGAYTGWESSEYASSDTTPLIDLGKEIIRREADPPTYFEAELTDTAGLYYMEDFIVGDACRAIRHRGARRLNQEGHVTRVRLVQRDTAGNVTPQIEIAAVGGNGTNGPDEDI